jgi:L-ascorbate metabolism protein UlaG (beta-lactamase superfamily)
MRITKYLHSCLLIEEQEKTILIDPGEYTYNAKIFPLASLENLDAIFITHEHADHCSIPFLKELIAQFPTVQLVTTESLVTKLKEEQINATVELPDFATAEIIPHEDVVIAVPPENLQFTFFGKLTHPGDSHHIKTTAPILALPIQAPWGSFANALKLAESLSPKYIIPIHDWHWKDEVRKGMYQRATEYLEQSGIICKGLETGEVYEVIV